MGTKGNSLRTQRLWYLTWWNGGHYCTALRRHQINGLRKGCPEGRLGAQAQPRPNGDSSLHWLWQERGLDAEVLEHEGSWARAFLIQNWHGSSHQGLVSLSCRPLRCSAGDKVGTLFELVTWCAWSTFIARAPMQPRESEWWPQRTDSQRLGTPRRSPPHAGSAGTKAWRP